MQKIKMERAEFKRGQISKKIGFPIISVKDENLCAGLVKFKNNFKGSALTIMDKSIIFMKT